MTEKHKKILRLAYYTLVSAALVAVAVLLMAACVRIYNLGDYPFTRALVAAEFDKIALPVYLCLGLVAVGFVLHPLLPALPDSDKDRDRMTVRRLRRTADLSRCTDKATAVAIRAEMTKRRYHRLITVALFAAGLGVLLWYALSFQRFSMEDINGSFVNFGLVMLPCLGIPAAYGVCALFYNRRSYRREIALYRPVLGEIKVTEPATADQKPWARVARYAILVAAIGLIVGGWLAGGWVDVLTKAINICTECVGLG